MNSSEKKQLKIAACKVRMGAIEGVFHAKSGHPGGSLSAADLYTYLYFKEMNINRKPPRILTVTVLSFPRVIALPACMLRWLCGATSPWMR